MKKQLTQTTACMLLVACIWASCKKETEHPPSPQQDRQLEISLNNSYMPADKIDSAFAIWEVKGTAQTIRLQVKDNKLTTSLTNLTINGAGTLSVQLFTQTKIKGIPLQWEKRFAYTLNRKEQIALSAPTALNDNSWNPRAICESTIHQAGFIAIIALRPEDPYFELKGIEPYIAKRIEVVRSFFYNDTTTLVASRGWIGSSNDLDSKGSILNREHFRNLDAQIDNRAWEKFKIRASFYANTNPNQIYEAEFDHERL